MDNKIYNNIVIIIIIIIIILLLLLLYHLFVIIKLIINKSTIKDSRIVEKRDRELTILSSI